MKHPLLCCIIDCIILQYGSSLYVTDWQEKTIERFDKVTGRNHVIIQNNMADLMDIKVVAPDKQIGALEHFCYFPICIAISLILDICYVLREARIAQCI